MNKVTKILIIVLSAVLLVAGSVAGTLAWLTAQTDPITNTFTIGQIGLELSETNRTYKIVPGVEIPKDPTVTVTANSEPCWVFVKVEKTNWNDTILQYDIVLDNAESPEIEGWTPLAGKEGVYYREVATSGEAQPFSVLAGDKVTVPSDVTKDQLATLSAPTLKFTAYAIQVAGFEENVAGAWNEFNH